MNTRISIRLIVSRPEGVQLLYVNFKVTVEEHEH
jgi:hypothetical protein